MPNELSKKVIGWGLLVIVILVVGLLIWQSKSFETDRIERSLQSDLDRLVVSLMEPRTVDDYVKSLRSLDSDVELFLKKLPQKTVTERELFRSLTVIKDLTRKTTSLDDFFSDRAGSTQRVTRQFVDNGEDDFHLIAAITDAEPFLRDGKSWFSRNQVLYVVWQQYLVQLSVVYSLSQQSRERDEDFGFPKWSDGKRTLAFLGNTFAYIVTIISLVGVTFGGHAAYNTWRESVRIRNEDLRWRKSNVANEIAKRMDDDKLNSYAMQMLESYEREYLMPPNNTPVRINKLRVLEAIERVNLRRTNASVQYQKDRFIYDCFDHFFSFMYLHEHHIKTGLVHEDDTKYPYYYYAPIMHKWKDLFEMYLKFHFPPECSEFLKRFHPWSPAKFKIVDLDLDRVTKDVLFELPEVNEAISFAGLRETKLVVVLAVDPKALLTKFTRLFRQKAAVDPKALLTKFTRLNEVVRSIVLRNRSSKITQSRPVVLCQY
ncbi:MAG: hypothetical protein IPJ30_02050 [Acidobacteria bacterium]|nr:hypothetical protein [Acidobacteriota bacterium]